MGQAHKGKARRGKRPARVFVVDDHEVLRKGFRYAFEGTEDLMVCGEAGDAASALAGIAAAKPDVVLVDLDLCGVLAFDLLDQLHQQWPALRLLVVSVHDPALYASRCLALGAHGYISKERSLQEIIAAIRCVLDEGRHVELPRAAAKRPVGRAAAAAGKLGNRECQVLRLLGLGQSNKEIADALAIDVRTVETYRQRMKAKLGLAHASELPRLAVLWTNRPAAPLL